MSLFVPHPRASGRAGSTENRNLIDQFGGDIRSPNLCEMPTRRLVKGCDVHQAISRSSVEPREDVLTALGQLNVVILPQQQLFALETHP